MLAALGRHLHENGAKFSITKDRHFKESWKILSGKAVELRQQGKGKNKADAITPSEEEQLWTRKVVGGDTPKSINLTIYFTISQHFGTRGCQEHHQLQVQDLKFIHDPQTQQTLYVEWVEIPIKTGREVLQRWKEGCPKRCLPQEMKGAL